MAQPGLDKAKEEDELEERIHFSNVITTFQKYSQYSVISLVDLKSIEN